MSKDWDIIEGNEEKCWTSNPPADGIGAAKSSSSVDNADRGSMQRNQVSLIVVEDGILAAIGYWYHVSTVPPTTPPANSFATSSSTTTSTSFSATSTSLFQQDFTVIDTGPARASELHQRMRFPTVLPDELAMSPPHWRQAALLLPSPRVVKAGDVIDIEVFMDLEVGVCINFH